MHTKLSQHDTISRRPKFELSRQGVQRGRVQLLFVLMAGIQHTPQLLQHFNAQGISMTDPVIAATSMLAWSDSVASRRPSSP